MSAALFISPIAAFTLLPAMFAIDETQRDAVEILKNMKASTLTEKTVYLGGTHHGFLYFKQENREDLKIIEGVHLKVKNIRTNEMLTFMVNIKDK